MRRRELLAGALAAPLLGTRALAGASGQAGFAAPQTDRFVLSGDFRQGGLIRGTAPRATSHAALNGKVVPLSRDGLFLIGLDRDQPASALLAAQLPDGRRIEQPIAVAPRSWPTQHLNIARRPGGSSEAFLRRRERELARIVAARAADVDSDGWRQRFVWPARGRISGVFGSQRVYRGEPASFHSGVDVAPGAGAPVVAPADGVVVLAGPPAFSLEGNLLIIAHGMGLNSAFLHLASQAVREGQAVRQGQLLGTVGATGRATGPHLHWSMKWQDARIDPQALAGPMSAG